MGIILPAHKQKLNNIFTVNDPVPYPSDQLILLLLVLWCINFRNFGRIPLETESVAPFHSYLPGTVQVHINS